jgi:hypothetical protein
MKERATADRDYREDYLSLLRSLAPSPHRISCDFRPRMSDGDPRGHETWYASSCITISEETIKIEDSRFAEAYFERRDTNAMMQWCRRETPREENEGRALSLCRRWRWRKLLIRDQFVVSIVIILADVNSLPLLSPLLLRHFLPWFDVWA